MTFSRDSRLFTKPSRLPVTETFQVFIPLNGQEIFLFIVTILAGRHKIALSAFSSSGKGDNMIHGYLPRINMSPTVITNPFRDFSLPPCRLSEFLCPLFLATYFSIIYLSIKRNQSPSFPSKISRKYSRSIRFSTIFKPFSLNHFYLSHKGSKNN